MGTYFTSRSVLTPSCGPRTLKLPKEQEPASAAGSRGETWDPECQKQVRGSWQPPSESRGLDRRALTLVAINSATLLLVVILLILWIADASDRSPATPTRG
mmetsp:Transcript_48218/g.86770  ORF Transcript_48218/g.86770 Transcript_48218/m.86770 type:complete len:101 (+) Transcript_48218:635-937(+)